MKAAAASLTVLFCAGLAIGLAAYLHNSDAERSHGDAADSSAEETQYPQRDVALATTGLAAAPIQADDAKEEASTPSRKAFTRKYVDLAGTASVLVPELERRARSGDADAAWELFQVLRNCKRRHTTAETGGSHPDLDCEGLDASAWADLNAWLITAAEYGSTDAQVNFMAYGFEKFMTLEDMIRNRVLFDDYARRAERYLTEAAQRGSVDAMVQLAGQYQDGLAFEQDPVRAYAYLYAYNQTDFGNRNSESWMYTVGGQLTPAQRNQAQSLGALIFRRCCR